DFANLRTAETEIAKSKMVAATMEREKCDLTMALIKLRLPFLSDKQAEALKETPTFINKIRPLLILFEYRFLNRIPGLVYLLEEATKTLNGEKFNGTRKYTGTVIRIDIAEFSKSTREEGEGPTAERLGNKFYPHLYDVLRRFPGIKFIKSIGDEVICVSETANESELNAFMQAVAQRTKTDGVGTHTGIAQGDFEITITPGGKVVINGEASERALAAQKESKRIQSVEGETTSRIFWNKNEIEQIEIPEEDIVLPDPPIESAINFCRNLQNRATLTQLATNPETLEKEIRAQMSMLAATITDYALKSETPVEREATVLALNTTPQEGEDVFKWEKRMEEMAEKYGGKVIYIDFHKDKKAEVIIAFGTRGSDQFHKEERALKCANELAKAETNCRIGIESGSIYISDSGRAGEVSDAINRAVRFANHEDPQHKIRIGEETTKKCKLANDTYNQIDVTIKHVKEPQSITTCDEVQISSEEQGYTRTKESRDLAAQIGAKLGETTTHFDITGEIEMGQDGILQETARILEEEHRLTAVKLGRHHDRHRSYSSIGQLLTTLFGERESFEAWAEKQGLDESQRGLWTNLYMELEGISEPRILNTPEVAKGELTAILKRLNLCVTCERFDSLDALSQEILKESPKVLITTKGNETNNSYKLEGLSAEEAADIAIDRLKIPAGINTSELRRNLSGHFKANLRTVKGRKYNLTMVRIVTEELLKSGALQVGTNSFNKALAQSKQNQELSLFLRAFVTKQIEDFINNHPESEAISFLKRAMLMENCQDDQLVDVIGQDGWERQKRNLVEAGILEDSEGIVFSYGFFPEIGRTLRTGRNELMPDEKAEIEMSARSSTGFNQESFPFSRYLTICERMGIALTPEVIEATATHAKEGMNRNQVLATMDTCQQFLETNREIHAVAPAQVGNLLSIHFNLIWSKILLGLEIEDDIKRAEGFVDQIGNPPEGELGILDLKFRKASKGKDIKEMRENLEKMRKLGISEETGHLKQAEIYHVESGKNKSIETSNQALEEIEKAGDTPEKKKLELEIKGYLYGFLTPRKNLSSTDIDEFIGAIETSETDLKTQLYVVAILRERNIGKDAERATALAQKIKTDAKKIGFMNEVATSLTYEINLAITNARNIIEKQGAAGAIAAFKKLEEAEELYDEAISYQKNESLRPIAWRIMGSILTTYECAVEQLEIIAANRSNPTLRSRLPEVRAKLKKVWDNATAYDNSNPDLNIIETFYKEDLKGLGERINAAELQLLPPRRSRTSHHGTEIRPQL
ncbi:MAG: hypothetical protein WCT46_05480, partial [Candidatus Gracilibacteria bacterium]